MLCRVLEIFNLSGTNEGKSPVETSKCLFLSLLLLFNTTFECFQQVFLLKTFLNLTPAVVLIDESVLTR